MLIFHIVNPFNHRSTCRCQPNFRNKQEQGLASLRTEPASLTAMTSTRMCSCWCGAVPKIVRQPGQYCALPVPFVDVFVG